MIGCWCLLQYIKSFFLLFIKKFREILTCWHWYNPPLDITYRRICTFLSRVHCTNVISSSRSKSTRLTKEEWNSGCMLGLDTWADTCCVGKHARINEIIKGKSVTATGFASSLKSIPDLPIVNCSLAYDSSDGKTYILKINNAIFLGEQMENCLLCPNQCEVNDVRITLRTKIIITHRF